MWKFKSSRPHNFSIVRSASAGTDPRAVIPSVEAIGERLYTARAAYMVDTKQGLTQTYNQLEAPRCDEPRILALRGVCYAGLSARHPA